MEQGITATQKTALGCKVLIQQFVPLCPYSSIEFLIKHDVTQLVLEWLIMGSKDYLYCHAILDIIQRLKISVAKLYPKSEISW